MLDKILIVMGLLSHTWSAIPYVRYLASNFGSKLYFLGVSTESQPVWDQSLLNYIESLSQTLREENISVKTDFIHGNPAVEVVKYAEKNEINLITTIAGAGNEITCSILGSIAKRIGINMSVPILLVPPQFSKDFDFSKKVRVLKILVPLDCSQISETALPYVETLAKRLHCSVSLLHVNTPPVRGVPVLHNEVINISRITGINYVNKIHKSFSDQHIKTNYEVIDGSAVKTILSFAKKNKVDLIVMGTRSLSGIEGWVCGSITNKVSERSEIPVLAICNSHLKPIE